MTEVKRYYLTYFLLIFSSLYAAGQAGRFYSPDNALSNSLVNSIYQDKKGFLWISTEDGLNRFDGTKFTIFKHSPDDPVSIPGNYTRTPFEDSAGNFWIGGINGLSRYDRATGAFHKIEMHREGKIVSPHVMRIIETSRGEIWLATAGMGLFVVRDGIAASVLSDKLTSGYLSCICEDSRGRLWIGTENDGVNLYDPATGRVRSYTAPARISGNYISSIAEDCEGNIFVGTLNQGLGIYDAATDRFRSVPHDGGRISVKTLHVNRDNVVFVGTDGQGLKVYNASTRRVEDYAVRSAPFDFSRAKVHSVFQDKDDNLWLGLFQKGVVLIPGAGSAKKFDYWGFKSSGASPIGGNSVMSVFKDHEGVVWVGTDSDGLYGVNENGDQVAHFAPDNSPGSVSSVIMSIYEDSNRELWVGSYANGLARLDRRTGKCVYVAELAGEKIYSIAEDGQGNLLVGTYGSGFYSIGLDDGRLTHFESTKREDDDFMIDALTNDWINDIMLDREGKVWLAHFNGVSCYDPVRKTFLNYLGQNTILPHRAAYTLCEDSEGRIWVGTTDGVHIFDKRGELISSYTAADGLAGNVICGILEDADGNMWISTYMGISKLIMAENRFVNFYSGDGLQGNEFTRGASYVDSNGKMYFGGIYGVTGFRPEEIVESKKIPDVLITDFFINDRAVRMGDRSGRHDVVETSVPDAGQFTLSHGDNTFSIEFSALEYANPERIVYQYKIEELGSAWINSYRGVDRATWINLPPGTYTFSVRALDNEIYSEPRTIRITITPPWYQSWWAYLLYAGLILFFVWLVTTWIRGRVGRRQADLKRRHAEQINEAKLQFFINISHEIRTPMTLIINPLEKLISESKDASLRKTYVMIHRNAQRILRLINQLMDIRKLDKGQMRLHFRETEIVGFIEEMMLTFEYLAQRKNIVFNFVHTDERLFVWIDPGNFDKVLLNILSNAFKYTPDNGNITIALEHGATNFTITVTDNGIGIDKSELENIFERFYRVNNDLTNANFGTGIGMHLARSLVEMHHGSITAAGREDASGTKFTVRLPLGNRHLSAEELDAASAYGEAPASPSPEARVFSDPATDGAVEKPRAKTRYRVLVVDDENDIREYIKSELAPLFRVSEATDGKSALEAILNQGADLVISDVMMPGMDGVELVRRIKQNVNINHIPVILLTSMASDESRIEGLDVGADGYITKPFNTEVLRSTVMNLLENRERLRNSLAGQQLIEDMTRRIELKSVDEQLMERVMDFINDNISNSDLSVEILASGVGMSRVHLHRRLKYLTGQSAGDFIKAIRLRQAASLLGEGKFTVSEVAYATGFSNLSHFSNSFKEFYGMSPTAYVNKPS